MHLTVLKENAEEVEKIFDNLLNLCELKTLFAPIMGPYL